MELDLACSSAQLEAVWRSKQRSERAAVDARRMRITAAGWALVVGRCCTAAPFDPTAAAVVLLGLLASLAGLMVEKIDDVRCIYPCCKPVEEGTQTSLECAQTGAPGPSTDGAAFGCSSMVAGRCSDPASSPPLPCCPQCSLRRLSRGQCGAVRRRCEGGSPLMPKALSTLGYARQPDHCCSDCRRTNDHAWCACTVVNPPTHCATQEGV